MLMLDSAEGDKQIQIKKELPQFKTPTINGRKSYISYRKPRTVSTEQRERAGKMMIANNRAKGDEGNFIGIVCGLW